MEELSRSLSQATLKLPQFAFIKTHGCEGFGLTKKQKELIDRHLSIITLVASGDTCYVGYKGFDKALLRVLEEVSKAATTPDGGGGGGGGGGPATTAPTTLWERSPGGDEMRRTFSTLLSSPDFNTAAGVSVNTTLLNPTVQWHFENVHREGSFKPVIMMYDTTSNQTIDDSWHDGTRIMPPTFTLLDLAKNMSKYGQLYPPNAPMVPTAPAGGGADGGTPAHAYLVIFSCRVPCWTPPRIVPRKTFARNNGKRRRLLGLHEAMWHPGSGQHIKKRKGGTRAGKRRRVKRWESRGRKNKRKCRTHRRRRRRRRQRKTRRRRRR